MLISPRGSSIKSSRVFVVCSGRLYRFMFHPTRALLAQINNNDLCEIWHKRIAHLYHRAFMMQREILLVYMSSTLSIIMCVGGVFWESAPRHLSLVVTTEL